MFKETASSDDIPTSMMTFIPQLPLETLSETLQITSQADQIRAQHERGKKRKISGLAKPNNGKKQTKKTNKNKIEIKTTYASQIL